MNIYRQDSNESAFNSENVAQALDFFGTLGEPGDSLTQSSEAEKSKLTSKPGLLDPGNIRNKNRKSEEECSDYRGKRKKRKRVTTKGEAKSSRFLCETFTVLKYQLLVLLNVVECL